MTQKKGNRIKPILFGVIAVILVALGAIGFIKAYSGVAPVVIENAVFNVENFVDGNGLGPALGGVTNYDELDVTDGYKVDGTTVIDGSGNVDAPITSTTGSFSSYLAANGGFTQGSSSGVLATSTLTSVVGTLSEAQLLAYSMIEVTPNIESATITLPATSTLTTLIPNAGDSRMWLIHNATTTAATSLTTAAGTGIDLVSVTNADDVIDGTEYSYLECFRQSDTDVTCIVSELLASD